jgi:hypothetical protein
MHLIIHPAHVLPCSNSTVKGPTKYCTTILLPKPSQNLPCVSLLKPGIPDCGLPGVTFVWCPGFVVVIPSSTHLTITCKAHIRQFLWRWSARWVFTCTAVALLFSSTVPLCICCLPMACVY